MRSDKSKISGGFCPHISQPSHSIVPSVYVPASIILSFIFWRGVSGGISLIIVCEHFKIKHSPHSSLMKSLVRIIKNCVRVSGNFVSTVLYVCVCDCLCLCLRGHSQMTSQHWTTNGNLKSWRKLTRETKGHQKRWWMMKNPMIRGNLSKTGLGGSH